MSAWIHACAELRCWCAGGTLDTCDTGPRSFLPSQCAIACGLAIAAPAPHACVLSLCARDPVPNMKVIVLSIQLRCYAASVAESSCQASDRLSSLPATRWMLLPGEPQSTLTLSSTSICNRQSLACISFILRHHTGPVPILYVAKNASQCTQ